MNVAAAVCIFTCSPVRQKGHRWLFPSRRTLSLSVLTTGNRALIGGETIAGITGRLPLQISGQGLVQSLCLLLLLITSCKNLITGKLNHSNLKLRSPTSLFTVISQSSIMEQKMLSCHEFGNELFLIPSKSSQGGKKKFSMRFLQTCALILTLPNTIGGGAASPQQCGNRKTHIQSKLNSTECTFDRTNRHRQRGGLSFYKAAVFFITNHQTLIKTMCIHNTVEFIVIL